MTSHTQSKKTIVILIISLGAFDGSLLQASPRGDNTQATAYPESEIQTLRNEVKTLRRELNYLSLQDKAGQPRSKQVKKRDSDSIIKDTQVEQGADPGTSVRLSKRFVAISSQFKSEQVDTKWAYVAEYRVRQALKGVTVRQVPGAGIICRATMCRLEVKSDSDTKLSLLGRELSMKLSREFPRGFIHRENTELGMSSLVVFLVREGQRLPKVLDKE